MIDSFERGFISPAGHLQDELLWGSAWLLWATKNSSYLGYLYSLGDIDRSVDMFSWDNKLAGARVLLSRVRHRNTNKIPLKHVGCWMFVSCCACLHGFTCN